MEPLWQAWRPPGDRGKNNNVQYRLTDHASSRAASGQAKKFLPKQAAEVGHAGMASGKTQQQDWWRWCQAVLSSQCWLVTNPSTTTHHHIRNPQQQQQQQTHEERGEDVLDYRRHLHVRCGGRWWMVLCADGVVVFLYKQQQQWILLPWKLQQWRRKRRR